MIPYITKYMPLRPRAATNVLSSIGFQLYVHWLSQSHTEHTAYTVGHPCKPYIQPNQPWPYPSYTRAIPVYPWKPFMIFKTLKNLTLVPCPCIIVLAIAYNHERPCETVRDGIYNRTWSPLHGWAKLVLYDRHTTNTVSYNRHTTNTVQVRIIHGHLRFLYFLCWKFENLWSQAIKTSQFYIKTYSNAW